MTDISFYTYASMYIHARLMMPHLSFKILCTYAIDMCMTVCRQTHACQQHTVYEALVVLNGQAHACACACTYVSLNWAVP